MSWEVDGTLIHSKDMTLSKHTSPDSTAGEARASVEPARTAMAGQSLNPLNILAENLRMPLCTSQGRAAITLGSLLLGGDPARHTGQDGTVSHREAPPPSKGILKRPSFKHKLGSERQECIQGEEGRAALLAGGGFTRTKGKKLMRPQPGLRLVTSVMSQSGRRPRAGPPCAAARAPGESAGFIAAAGLNGALELAEPPPACSALCFSCPASWGLLWPPPPPTPRGVQRALPCGARTCRQRQGAGPWGTAGWLSGASPLPSPCPAMCAWM